MHLPATASLALNPLDPHSLLASLWQVVGGLVWSLGVTLAGYALGSRIPGIDRYLLPIIAVIVVLSLLPVLAEFLRSRRSPERGSRPAVPVSTSIPTEEGRQ